MNGAPKKGFGPARLVRAGAPATDLNPWRTQHPSQQAPPCPPQTPRTPILPKKLAGNPDILEHMPPALAILSPEISVGPTATPGSRHSDPTPHQG